MQTYIIPDADGEEVNEYLSNPNALGPTGRLRLSLAENPRLPSGSAPERNYGRGTIIVRHGRLWEVYDYKYCYEERTWFYFVCPQGLVADSRTETKKYPEARITLYLRPKQKYFKREIHKHPSLGDWKVEKPEFIANDEKPEWAYYLVHCNDNHPSDWFWESTLDEWIMIIEAREREREERRRFPAVIARPFRHGHGRP